LFFFLPGKPHFFRIDDDHKIARIHMRRENRLSPRAIGCLYRYSSQHLVGGVDYPPLARTSLALAENVFILEKGTKLRATRDRQPHPTADETP
jgi:hypothetical protein